jgi:hypothetical protein
MGKGTKEDKAVIVHKMKNVLGVISVCAQYLYGNRKIDAKERDQCLKKVEKEVHRAVELLEKIEKL